LLEINKVYQGDCLEIMKDIDDNSIDLLLTDIPYGEVNRKSNGLRNLDKDKADDILFALEHFLNECTRVTRGSMYIFCGTEQVSEIRKYLVKNKMSTRMCIWEKTNPSPMNGQHIWLSGIECCVFGKFRKATFNEHCKNTVWRFPNGRSKVHPTAKPLPLMEYLVQTSSNEDDLILDPCAGSGTTGVACQNLGRNFILIEKEPEYVEICEKRLAENSCTQDQRLEN
jgi:DNA modification methylase